MIITLSIILFLWLIMPMFLLAVTPFTAKRLRWLDSVWGNKLDGLGYDFQKESSRVTMPNTWYNRRWPRYFWLIRNPASNLLRRLGPDGIVEWVHYQGILTTAKIGKHVYFLIHWKHVWGKHYSEIKIGVKLWDDDRTKSKLIPGHRFQNSLAFSFQPWRRKT